MLRPMEGIIMSRWLAFILGILLAATGSSQAWSHCGERSVATEAASR
jgi:hypothetical protein